VHESSQALEDEVQRAVFFVSDGTGITAETLGGALLTQFEGLSFARSTLPFINSVEKARRTRDYINHVAATASRRPLVFSTIVDDAVRAAMREVDALFVDLFDQLLPPIEGELARRSSHAAGRAHGLADPVRYAARIAAMNFAMEHDDGQSLRQLQRAEVVLIAPSRCGKTPTALYLSLQHSILAANVPLTEEDLATPALPRALRGLEPRLFGLTNDPMRLAEVRGERRPGSRYASLDQCAWELRQAEVLYRRGNIPAIDVSSRSIEEIAAEVISALRLRR
jgi:Uncharacterized protein conserved in bacteria